MADQNSVGGDSNNNQRSKSTRHQVPFYKLFSFADSKDVLLMVIGTIASLGNGMCMPIMTLFFGDIINAFGLIEKNTDSLPAVYKVCLKFVYLAIGAGVTSFFQVTCWMITGERQASRMRSLYLQTILRQDVGFFDTETSTGEVIGRMSGDTVLIQDAMGEKVGKFLQLLATFVGGFVIAFIKGWLLALVMLSIIPPLVISAAVMTITLSKMASRGQDAYSQAGIIVEQTIGSIRTVASFTGEKHAITRYDKSLNKAYKSGVQEGLALGLGMGVVMFILFSSWGLALWYGGKLIIGKGYTGGDVLNVIVAVLTGSMSLGQSSPCLTAFAAGQAAAFKMFETINRKPEIDSYDKNGRILDEICGDIEFKDVSFSYPARPDEQIFNGFSLVIPSGTTYALVGQSGSGKSSVISLVERFYDPQAGEILIDGINLKEFQLRWIRGKIGLVSQEPVLFTSSIRENISYGKDGATDEEIQSASELANATKFIDNLPLGLDTLVGEHRTQLSGGQKQRIAIARAILKDPRILLLDEATSALDAESEHIVQVALDRIMVNRTTLIVAHRMSTIRNADVISVIQRGKIVESGTHLELLKFPDGAYSQLILLQEQITSNEGSAENVELCRSSSQDISCERSVNHGLSEIEGGRHRSFSGNIKDTVPENPEYTPRSIEKTKQVPFHRLANLNKPEIPVLVLGVISAIVAGVVYPIFALLLSNIIETYFEPKDELRKDLRFWSLMVVILGVVSLVAHPAVTYFFSVAGCRLIQRVRSMCFEKVVHMEINWFDKPEHSSGSIGARLSADAATMRSLVGDELALLVQDAASVVAGLVIAFEANWILSFIVIGVIPLVGFNAYVQLKFMKGFSADAKSVYEEASQVANDAVGNIRTISSFGAEDRVMQLYKKQCEGPMKRGIKLGVLSGTGFGISNFMLFCVYAISFYFGARLVDDGKATFPKVFRVFFALVLTGIAISKTSSLAPDSSKAKTSSASILEILDGKSAIDSSDESGMKLENAKGEIELQHVSFKYPTRTNIHIFEDFCLAMPAGKTVALVGESGSGKSTVISLLLRFYDPDAGHITLDGVDIRKFQLRWLRQQMALVGQEPVLFNDTIRANIAYGKERDATETEIIAAAKLANAHSFISGLQQGYDAIVGERGSQLSGGQKQRVAIARAMVKSPKILLLDEATSALDAGSEKVVQDALDRVTANRTTIVVAHRLSTIRTADVIAVVKNGVVAEEGSHDSLINNPENGVYASLVRLHMSASS